jgi:hypothetical protein
MPSLQEQICAMAAGENLVQLLISTYPKHSSADALQAAHSELRKDGMAQAASWARVAAALLCARDPEQ